MSSGTQDLAEARRVREEGERLARAGQDMNRAAVFLYLRDELGYQPCAADAAIQEADATTWHGIERVPMVRPALFLVADCPGAIGWPASGRYHIEVA